MFNTIAPYLGYLATALLGLSLIVTKDIQFRWLNTFGCISFIIYGLFIGAIPVVLTNGILLAINGFYLYKIYQRSETFDIIECKGHEVLIGKFMDFYKQDITKYFPNFNISSSNATIQFVVLRDLVIANIFIATLDEQGNARVQLNYTTPAYRDFKIGKYIFEKEKKILLQKGVKAIMYERAAYQGHLDFLKKMGFKKDNQRDCFLKPL
jgi:hypothetical protein